MQYPVTITPDGDTWMVEFPDVPEARTCGDTKEEALAEAADALVTAFEFYFEDQRPVPAPSKVKRGVDAVSIPASVWSKVLLLNSMLELGITQSELGRRIGMRRQDVGRLVNLHHATKIDTLEQAIAATGKRLEIGVD